MAAAARPGPEELALLEKLLGLPKGNKYGVQGERKVPVLQTNNGPGLTGLITIAAHLVKQAKKDQLLGSTAEEKAVVQQWLEYRVTQVDGCSSKEDTRIILKNLNIHLEDKVYLAGNIFTLADVLMYYGLHHVMAWPLFSALVVTTGTAAAAERCASHLSLCRQAGGIPGQDTEGCGNCSIICGPVLPSSTIHRH
ncbi:eukaryotic translation elongation factor 1 epsilon-1 isoform X1 [Aquila chrysaetos chrysaetos]|uniref:eukaryotic translation elongation factor 1 epsilon-1 isoform X1 n=1 Tax=Aquila chrysaetos chrysaetos TaxID=223781 RepID=UPI001B7D3DDE|nr:eukaryotic translation elongation factor 1 epsilon-1 isoform X1 [Aquila chrysaetos chrysaetos]